MFIGNETHEEIMVARYADDLSGNRGDTINSVHNCFEIIHVLQELGGDAKLSDIDTKVDISKSSVHKHLNTLFRIGYVDKNGPKYRLSMNFLDLGGFVRDQYPENKTIKAKVVELAKKTNELAFFNVEAHGKQIVLFREAGDSSVATRTRVGARLYLHQGAAGKAILSQHSNETIGEIVNRHGLPAETDKTITDYEALIDEIDRVRERGYATSEEEATEGLLSVAVPLTKNEGEPIGSFAVAGPVHRMTDQAYGEIPNALRSIVNEMELKMRHSPS